MRTNLNYKISKHPRKILDNYITWLKVTHIVTKHQYISGLDIAQVKKYLKN